MHVLHTSLYICSTYPWWEAWTVMKRGRQNIVSLAIQNHIKMLAIKEWRQSRATSNPCKILWQKWSLSLQHQPETYTKYSFIFHSGLVSMHIFLCSKHLSVKYDMDKGAHVHMFIPTSNTNPYMGVQNRVSEWERERHHSLVLWGNGKSYSSKYRGPWKNLLKAEEISHKSRNYFVLSLGKCIVCQGKGLVTHRSMILIQTIDQMDPTTYEKLLRMILNGRSQGIWLINIKLRR